MIDQATRDRICALLAQGLSLRAVCREKGMPSDWSVRQLALTDPEFGSQYARAREMQAEGYADEIVEIADTDDDPNSRRVRIDARKWIACKLLPKRYGDKVEHELSGEVRVEKITREIVRPADETQDPGR